MHETTGPETAPAPPIATADPWNAAPAPVVDGDDGDGGGDGEKQITALEADIALVDAAMSHLDAGDLEASEAAVGQLDTGADPTLFASPAT